MSSGEARDRLEAVRTRIAEACRQSGRTPGDVTLIAVSKTKPWEQLADFAALGVKEFGENYVQEALLKREAAATAGYGDLHWHLIGTLQSNKAKFVPRQFCLFHALDSVSLARKLDRAAAAEGVVQHCLLEVNVHLEATKGGVGEALAPKVLGELSALANLRVTGLMCIPAPAKDPRAPFARLRELRDSLNASGAYREPLRELSMGMSSDFDSAVLEGATLVRVGTTLFGART